MVVLIMIILIPVTVISGYLIGEAIEPQFGKVTTFIVLAFWFIVIKPIAEKLIDQFVKKYLD